MHKPSERLLPLEIVARRLRVTARWLRAEVEAGRLPGLRAERRVLLDPETTERLLLERARVVTKKGDRD